MSLKSTARRAALRALFSLPAPMLRALAERKLGMERSVGGHELSPQAHLLIAFSNSQPQPDHAMLTPEESRQKVEAVCEFFGFRGPSVRRVRDMEISSSGSELPARLYVPHGATDRGPLLLYFHGGGFVDGTLDTIDPVCRLLASRSRLRLLSVEYRKAPEHPFPAPVEDAYVAWRWACEHALELGARRDRIAIGGDSSGANLATVVCQLARADEETPAFQLLLYPVVDASRRTGSFDTFGERLGLTSAKYDWFLDHYGTRKQRLDPRLSPLLAEDLSDMPPALVMTAELDVLHDEGARYAQRLREAGGAVDERCQGGLFHGFARFFEVIDDSRLALEELADILRARMNALPS